MTYKQLLQLIILLLTAYISTIFVMPSIIRLMRKWQVLAFPNERNIHETPTPTAGGLGFGLVIIFIQIVVGWLHITESYGSALIKLGVISIILLIFGFFDDKYQSRVRYKLMGQLLTALLMYYAGYRVLYLTNPLGNNFMLGWISLPVTLFWFLLTMNAINLIDGMDGLASGITCIVCIVLGSIAMRENNELAIILSAILFATNLAFLKYNFYPAKIFMGDTGSLLIGLNIAAISTASKATYKGITTMTLMVPFIVLSLPILDTVLAVFRRLGKSSIFKADKAHIHHYLLDLGLTQRTIAFIAYFLTFLFGLAAIGFSFSSHKTVISTVVVVMVIMIVCAYLIMHKNRK